MGGSAPVVGIWGTFDVENYGDHLFPRITGRELGRRIPSVKLRLFSPYGWLHPTPLDGGTPAEWLGPWSEPRLFELADAHHCVLIGGGELIHMRDELIAPAYGVGPEELGLVNPSRYFVEGLGPDLEQACPVVWNSVGLPFDPTPDESARLKAALSRRPYVAVRDELSRERLDRAGVTADIAVVPDLALLLPRLLSPSSLGDRLDRLRKDGWYPDGPALVLQGHHDLVPFAPDLAALVHRLLDDRPGLAPVLVETGGCRGDGAFADALEAALCVEPVFRLPSGTALEDLAAAIAGAAAFAGSSLHGSITALAYGTPFVVMNLTAESKLDGFGRLLGDGRAVVHQLTDVSPRLAAVLDGTAPVLDGVLPALHARIDAHFDRVAGIIERVAAARPVRPGPLPEQEHAHLAAYVAALHTRVADCRAEIIALRSAVETGRRATDDARLVAETAARTAAESARSTEEAKRAATKAEEELARLLGTKTFRYLAEPRRLYSRFRRAMKPPQ